MVDPLLVFTDFGTTYAHLNDTVIPGGNASEALLAPALLFAPAADEGTRVSVHAEPINVVGYQMELPSAPPWRTQTSGAHARSALGMAAAPVPNLLPIDDTQVTVEAHGLPDDAAFARLVEEHEAVHVGDIFTLFEQAIVRWDARIKEFMDRNDSVVGESRADAKHRFYEQMGGTAEELGLTFEAVFRSTGLAFHDTPAGASPTIDHTTYDVASQTLQVFWKHPMG